MTPRETGRLIPSMLSLLQRAVHGVGETVGAGPSQTYEHGGNRLGRVNGQDK